MSPLNLRFQYCVGPNSNDPFVVEYTLSYKLDCPDGKTYGRGLELKGPEITPEVFEFLEKSINQTWKEHSLVSA